MEIAPCAESGQHKNYFGFYELANMRFLKGPPQDMEWESDLYKPLFVCLRNAGVNGQAEF